MASLHVSGLPIELLDLVMAYLDPWDLLCLGRVSKGFREIVITPNAANLWKQSIQSVGLPSCPDGMTEPAYIAFVFDTEYCVCGNSPAPLLIPQLKIRLCVKCKSKHVQWFNPHAIARLVAPPALRAIAPNLVTPFPLGNDHEMQAFYVPELNSNLLRASEPGEDPSVVVSQLLAAAAGKISFSQSLWQWCLERQRARAFRKLPTLGFSPEVISSEWRDLERHLFDKVVLMGVRDWSDQYWEDHVIPRLIPIFRSVKTHVEKQKHRGNIEARQQDSTLKRAPLVQTLLSENNYQIPVTPDRFSSIQDELVMWVDRELAPIYSAMANSFRSTHQVSLSPSISGVSDRELLEKVVTMFGCVSCKGVYDYKAHSKHGKECPKAIRARSLGPQCSKPVGKHAIILAVRLLQLLGLPEDSTRALVEQTFCETKFVCLCGNPRFRKQVGFFALLQHLISENEAHEELDSKVQVGVKHSDPSEEPLCEVSLINDHHLSLLPSLIRRVGPGQPQWKFETRPSNTYGPRKPHQAHCDLCFQLTGVRMFLGNDKEYTAYHMEAKHGRHFV